MPELETVNEVVPFKVYQCDHCHHLFCWINVHFEATTATLTYTHNPSWALCP